MCRLTNAEREILAILRRNNDTYAQKLLVRAMNLEKVFHKDTATTEEIVTHARANEILDQIVDERTLGIIYHFILGLHKDEATEVLNKSIRR